jgi:hypothetical protein
VKLGRSTSWQTRRLIVDGWDNVEYDAVNTVPEEWRTVRTHRVYGKQRRALADQRELRADAQVSLDEGTSVRSVMSAIEAEYKEKYIPKPLLTAQQSTHVHRAFTDRVDVV